MAALAERHAAGQASPDAAQVDLRGVGKAFRTKRGRIVAFTGIELSVV